MSLSLLRTILPNLSAMIDRLTCASVDDSQWEVEKHMPALIPWLRIVTDVDQWDRLLQDHAKVSLSRQGIAYQVNNALTSHLRIRKWQTW
jgi:P2-related tail formation protein